MTGPGGVRVVLCDDHAGIRAALREVVGAMPGFVVVGEAADGPALLLLLARTKAELLVLDVGLPGGGPELAVQVRDSHPDVVVVVFSAQADPQVREAMARAGVADYVLKTGRLGPLRAALLHHGAVPVP